IQWQKNGVNIPGAINSSYNVIHPGNYRAIVSTLQFSDTSNTVLIVELPTPPLPVIQRNADTLYTNTDYQSVWYLNGNPIPGATDWFYVPDSSAYYKVLQTDTSSGCNHMSLIY